MTTEIENQDEEDKKPQGSAKVGFIAIGVIILLIVGGVALCNIEPSPRTLEEEIETFRHYASRAETTPNLKTLAALCAQADSTRDMALAQGADAAPYARVSSWCVEYNVPSFYMLNRMTDLEKALTANRLGVVTGD